MMTFPSLYNILLSLRLVIAFIRDYLMFCASSTALCPWPRALDSGFPPSSPLYVMGSPGQGSQGDRDMSTWTLCPSALLNLASEPLDSRIPCPDGPTCPFRSSLQRQMFSLCAHSKAKGWWRRRCVASTGVCKTPHGKGRGWVFFIYSVEHSMSPSVWKFMCLSPGKLSYFIITFCC